MRIEYRQQRGQRVVAAPPLARDIVAQRVTERARAMLARREVERVLALGDPKPGRSALDRAAPPPRRPWFDAAKISATRTPPVRDYFSKRGEGEADDDD